MGKTVRPPVSYALPFLNDEGRQRYAAFQEMPRVFVIAVDGTSVSSHDGYDPRARALEPCRTNGHPGQIPPLTDINDWPTSVHMKELGGAPATKRVWRGRLPIIGRDSQRHNFR
jgi:hypothetical protein